MYIPYDKIGATIALFLPAQYRRITREFFLELKTRANCSYIEKNVKKVQKKLQKETKTRKLKVGFLVYDETKWKCQSLYDLFNKSNEFSPVVLVTKNCSAKNNFNYQNPQTIKRIYQFFKNKGMNVEYAWDFKDSNSKDSCKNLAIANSNDDIGSFIPLTKFKLDIIFYQHPWYIETSQGPVQCSKDSLTYYIPYYLPNTTLPQDYYLRFHRYIHKYYVLNQGLVDRYSKLMKNKGENLVAAGTPQLDYFYFKTNENDSKLNNKDKKYLIYAPHWSVNHKGTIAYSTFLWSGRIILEYAKAHPELNWVFKPHPLLESALLTNKYWSQEEVDDYYNAWDKIGMRYESGDYLELFSCANAMITDCGSFLTEFFLTRMPVIRLQSPDCVPCYDFVEKIISVYYNAANKEELEQYFNDVILNKNDYKKQQRLNMLNELEFENNYSARNIYLDIKKELGIK